MGEQPLQTKMQRDFVEAPRIAQVDTLALRSVLVMSVASLLVVSSTLRERICSEYQRRKKLTLLWPFYASRQKRFAFRLRRGLRFTPRRFLSSSRGRYGGRSRGPYTSDH